uniref:LUCI_3 protein n=1 Tax=Fopius arisanus TaxID=64838 RepID=A0A0C9RMN7_9HYME
MADRITSCSMWLKKGNVQPGDIIGICTSNNLNAVIPLVASLLAEAIPNPWWDAVLTDDTIKHFLNLTKPKIIFSDEMKIKKIKEVVDKTGENIRIVCLGDIPGFESLNHIIENTDPDAMAKFKCEDLKDLQEAAVILYTSGTSGYPKGVLLPYSCLIAEMGPMCETPEIIFRTAGINWITGLMNALVTIGACSTTVIHPNLDEKIILEIVEKYKVCSFVHKVFLILVLT